MSEISELIEQMRTHVVFYKTMSPHRENCLAVCSMLESQLTQISKLGRRGDELEAAFHMACGTISTMPEWSDKHPMDVSDEYLRLAKDHLEHWEEDLEKVILSLKIND